MSTERLAVVVGASRGLGFGLVRELLARGWRVLATVRDSAGQQALDGLGATFPGALEIDRLDIARTSEVEAFAGRHSGKVFDLLFVNAGVFGPKHQSASEVTSDELLALFGTNAIAPIRLAELLLDRVRPGSGTVAFMSSRLGSIAANTTGGTALYRASKAALNSLVRSFVASAGRDDITVLTLHPGWVRTDMGGPGAPLDVPTSVAGLADVVERAAGSHQHRFLDYSGAEIPW